MGLGLNNNCNTIAFDSSGNLYAGGGFTQAGGLPANRIAKWNGINWSALGTGLSNICNTIAFDYSGKLYAGGQFTQAGGVYAYHIASYSNDYVNLIVNTIYIGTLEYKQTKIILISNGLGYSLSFT